MNNRKNYNSIVFLTTLSVYLGLVLAGSPSPALAHSALTRNFDIREEIEFQDDLDKKPDDESCPELGENTGNQLKEFGLDKYAALNFGNLSKSSFTGLAAAASELQSSKNAFDDFLLQESKKGVFDSSLKFKITSEESVSGNNFTYSLELPKPANLLASSFDYGFKDEDSRSDDKFESLTYTNADISHSNDQVFIVTNLPRASIDTLLAENNVR